MSTITPGRPAFIKDDNQEVTVKSVYNQGTWAHIEYKDENNIPTQEHILTSDLRGSDLTEQEINKLNQRSNSPFSNNPDFS